MRYLTVDEVFALHARVIEKTGGSRGVRDRGGLESAVAQPQMTFGGLDLNPTLARKAAALAHSLISNHPFVDGNKRVGHAAMEVMLVLNGHEISATLEEQETVVLSVAGGRMSRDEFAEWVEQHVVERPAVDT